MKSAYERAMEKMQAASGPLRELSKAQRAALQELDSKLDAQAAQVKEQANLLLRQIATTLPVDMVAVEVLEDVEPDSLLFCDTETSSFSIALLGSVDGGTTAAVSCISSFPYVASSNDVWSDESTLSVRFCAIENISVPSRRMIWAK